MKDSKEVVKEFNELVNMTTSELENWLKSDDSQSAGWPKENEEGESVGHDSGRKIVEILKANPNKDADKYTDDQVQHMRKVVSYCKRHLAQEEKSNNEKSAGEVKKTKSYASLKNWGHDPLKARGEGGDAEEDEGDEEKEKQAGDKRKKGTDAQEGSNKKRDIGSAAEKQKNGKKSDEEEEEADEKEEEQEGGDDKEGSTDEKKSNKSNGTQKNGQTNGQNKAKKEEKNDEGNDVQEEGEEGEEEEEEEGDGDDGDASGTKPNKGPKKGDTVSWNWGSGQPQGKVLDVKAEKTTITTKRGNEVSRDGNPEDPAVVIDAGKSKAIKSNHELN